MISEIIKCFRTPITVRRTNEATSFVDGLAQQVTDVNTFTVNDVCFQPMSGRERQVLPELIRDREVIKGYTCCELKGVDVEGKVLADRIDWNGQEYVVESVEAWDMHGGYWKVLAVKEND